MANSTTNLNDKDPEKSVDLPPYGARNADPVSDQPGSHPIEVGMGAALGGAASGAAVGLVAGPIGAAIGAAVGAIAGGLAGKGVGELIDPTTQDNWLRESFAEKTYVDRTKGESFEHYTPAYKYAADAAQTKYAGKSYHEVETHLQSDYEKTDHAKTMGWDKAKHAVKDAYDRTIQLREEKLNVGKEKVQTGEASVRKEVHTEQKTITVPVEREELVIERHAVHSGTAVHGDIKAEEIRIPLKEERVNVSKETVVKEEVSVGTKKVQGEQTVGAEVKREELVVDKGTTGHTSTTTTTTSHDKK